MSDKTFRYKVEIDTSDVARATAEVRRAFATVTNQVPVGGPVGSSGGSSGGGLLGGGMIKNILGASIAGYGLTQLAQVAMQLGQLGAANQRTQKSFDGLAEGANLASDVLLGKLRSATQGTVTSQRLMASTNMLLVSAQNGQINVTEKQIETLAKFARLRATQLGISTEDAYNRLIFGTVKRETELLDELGISTKGLADIIGVPVQNINKDVNSLLGAIVKVAEQDVAKFGDPVKDEAAKIEDAMNQMAESWDRLAAASAQPVAFTLTFVAEAVEHAGGTWNNLAAMWDQLANDPREGIREMLKERGFSPLGNMFLAPPRVFNDPSNTPLRNVYSELGDAQRAAAANNPVPMGPEGGVQLQKITNLVRGLSDAYVQLSGLQTTGAFDAGQLGEVESAWQTIVDGITDGSLELDDANVKLSQMLVLLSQIAPIIGPQVASAAKAINPLIQGITSSWAARSRQNQVVAGTVPVDELTESEKKYRLAVGETTEQQAIYRASLDNLAVGSDEAYAALIKIAGLGEQADAQNERTAQEIRDKRQGLLNAQLGLNMARTDTPGQVALLQSLGQTLVAGSVEDLNNQERIAGLQSRMIEDSRQEWKRTAQEVERNFEAAADKIMGIPGVTSLTSVTPQNMLDTKYGVYQDQPDEWVRRVRDELTAFDRQTRTDEYGNTTETLVPRKTRDYEDVSREQVERLTGMAPGTPHDVMIPRLEQKWQSGSLFADPANLSLLNMDAIRGQYDEMKAGTAGRSNQRQFIMSELGIGAADAALLTGTQAPLVQMLTGGQSNEEIAAQMQGLGTTITERVLAPLQSGGLVKTLADGWKVDVQDNITMLYGPVDSLASAVNGRLNEKIGDGLKIVDIVVARVLAEIADSL